MQILKDKPWIPFLTLALVTQQLTMLTYKFASDQVNQMVFMAYVFAFMSVSNFALMFFFKNRGFPISIKGKMRFWIFVVAVVYILNELTLITVYRMGAPFSLVMAVFSILSLMIMVSVSVIAMGEKITPRKMLGLALGVASILLIKLG